MITRKMPRLTLKKITEAASLLLHLSISAFRFFSHYWRLSDIGLQRERSRSNNMWHNTSQHVSQKVSQSAPQIVVINGEWKKGIVSVFWIWRCVSEKQIFLSFFWNVCFCVKQCNFYLNGITWRCCSLFFVWEWMIFNKCFNIKTISINLSTWQSA